MDLDRVIGEYSDYIESFVADSEQNYIYVIKMPQGDLRQCEDGVLFDFAGHFRDDMNVVGMHGVIVAAECGAWSLTTDGGLYFHDPGYSNMEDVLYEDTADKKFTGLYGIYESNWYMWDAISFYYYDRLCKNYKNLMVSKR